MVEYLFNDLFVSVVKFNYFNGRLLVNTLRVFVGRNRKGAVSRELNVVVSSGNYAHQLAFSKE